MPDADPEAGAVEAYTERTEYALHVVTTTSDVGEPSGCLVGFATQCSIDPPRFLVCISEANHTYAAVEHSDAVALHLLGRDQVPLASLFAEVSGDHLDKFVRCRSRTGVTGAPVLVDCVAWMEGTIIGRWSVGDHQALLVRPVAGGAGGHRDVLTMQHSPDFRPGHPTGG